MTDDTEQRCWVVRTDRTVTEQLIGPELKRGILRQGWGWNPKQDLRLIRSTLNTAPAEIDDDQWGAWSHNRRLLPEENDSIASGDLLVLPHTPHVGQWSIAEACDDYDFSLAYTEDHGHRRRVRLLLAGLHPSAHDLPATLRRTMRCQRAIWNIDHHASTIAALASGTVGPRRALDDSLGYVQQAAHRAGWEALQDQFGGAELEAPTQLILESTFDTVEHRGGPAENGADFICRFVGPFGIEFAVAIQLKMWTGVAEDLTPLRQLAQAADQTPLSALIALTTATTTSPKFNDAAKTLGTTLGVPVKVVCRDEFMELLAASSARTNAPSKGTSPPAAARWGQTGIS